ncbi:MAG: hypothetical protein ACSHYB_12500 [Roseibacillus sp.]
MGKRLLLLVLFAAFVVGCRKKEESRATGGNTGVAKSERQMARSFDPVYRDLTEPNSGVETQKEKTETTVLGSATKGREMGLAQDIFKMEPSVARNLAMTQLFSQWIESDTDAAMTFGLTVYDDVDMKRAFHQGIAPYLSEHRPERLLEIISNGNFWEGQWREERAALHRVARKDFAAAAEFFVNTGPGKQFGEEAYWFTSTIAQEQSVEAALAYAERLQGPNGKRAGIRAAVASWVLEDLDAASEYARNTPDPLQRDYALLGFADALWETNPEETISWTGGIEDEDLRLRTYTGLAQGWQDSGASESVEKLLASPSLSPAERRAIEEVMTPQGE